MKAAEAITAAPENWILRRCCMYRRDFLRTLALAAPIGAVVPYFNKLAAQERRRVKITDVKVMRL